MAPSCGLTLLNSLVFKQTNDRQTGMLVQEALTGQGPIEQLLAGHISPFGDGQGAF